MQSWFIAYPATVLVGSMVQAFVQPFSETWADKRNPLNVYFVKYAWAWTSLPLLGLILLEPNRNKIAVWTSASLYWFLMTQWFFGASLLDRVLEQTGQCVDSSNIVLVQVPDRRECRLQGALWNGLDISGHCFILIHSSLFILHFLQGSRLKIRSPDPSHIISVVLNILASFMLILWLLMLTSTSLFFHSITEKIFGSILGLVFWCVYSIFSKRVSSKENIEATRMSTPAKK